MCHPVADGKKFYTVSMEAHRTCDMGYEHGPKYGREECERFADAFKAVRAFWEENRGARIEVKLSISADATDHLKAVE